MKNIVGGSFIDASAGGYAGNNTNSVGGDTCVSITAPGGVVFTGNIYGGSYATGNSTSSAKVTGNSSLTLNGGLTAALCMPAAAASMVPPPARLP